MPTMTFKKFPEPAYLIRFNHYCDLYYADVEEWRVDTAEKLRKQIEEEKQHCGLSDYWIGRRDLAKELLEAI